MKRYFGLIIIFLAFNVNAQFGQELKIALPDTLTIDKLEWMDADNDSLLDIVVVAHSVDDKSVLLFYKNNKAIEFQYVSKVITEMQQLSYLLTDFDLDNQIDILVSGVVDASPITLVYINKGDFVFEALPSPILSRMGKVMLMGDLNMNGRKELIISGEDTNGAFFTIYENKSSQWLIAHDSLKIKADEILMADYNGDLFNDLFIRGKKNDNSPYCAILFNRGNLYFTDIIEIPITVETISTSADFNYDGKFDFLILQKSLEAKLYLSNSDGDFLIKDSTLTDTFPSSLFAADFNSNGKVDIHYRGQNNLGNETDFMQYDQAPKESILRAGTVYEMFGDYDRDGDLDLMQATLDTLYLMRNKTTQQNEPPFTPPTVVGYKVFDRLFVYWERSGDDHTPADALTYDATIQSNQGDVMSGDFDLFNTRRTLVTHGNAGTLNFLLIKNLPGTQFNFAIQSVDNAFHAGVNFVLNTGGICRGSLHESCQEDLVLEQIPTCGKEIIKLENENPNALWFSFSKGFLGMMKTLTIEGSSTDTLFSYNPTAEGGCGILTLYEIKRDNNLTKRDSTKQYVCEGSNINMTTEDGWQTIEWSSSSMGTFSTAQSISYTVAQDDFVTVKLSDGSGCFIERTTSFIVSKPSVTLQNDTYQLLKGESVLLQADGGTSYLWQPPSGLNKTDISNPVASPIQSTEYLVTTFDSIGCSATGKVLVIVENTAFIPTLFTPNDDGKNDVLKIYGLAQTNNFSFSIYNREGNIVYKSENGIEVSSNGWNGTVNGVLQPAGVYHWKVKGSDSGGKNLLLNGKQSGSIVLIR